MVVTCQNVNWKEVVWVIRSLKHGKAAGIEQSPAERIKYGGFVVWNSVWVLCNTNLNTRTVPDDGTSAVIVPL